MQRRVFLSLYLLGVLVLAVQPVRTLMAPWYEGVMFRSDDESQYIMRIEQALLHPLTDVSNSITSGPDAPRGLQMTFPETLVGSAFSWTGISASSLALWLSVLLAPLVMPLLALLMSRFGVRKIIAIILSTLFFFLLIGPLRRVIHQSWSLPYVLFTLLLMVDWFRQPTKKSTLGLGIILGLLPGIYFWAWTYGWAVFGILVASEVIVRVRKKEAVGPFFWHAASALIVAFIVASPFLMLMWMNSHDPTAAETSLRSSLIAAREFESITRSFVLVIFTIGITGALFKRRDRSLTPVFAMALGLLIVLHQQFIHGNVLSFWTHYYPYVCAVSILSVGLFESWNKRGVFGYVATGAACLFILGAYQDYSSRLSILAPLPIEQYQHLSEPLALLAKETEKQTVLSDRNTSLLVGMNTDHDLAFTVYLRHVLLSTEELAERYCLVDSLSPVSDPDWLAYTIKEISAAGKEGTEEVLQRDLVTVRQACEVVRSETKSALSEYGVTRLLWDEKIYPEWKIDERLFEKISSGEGWSLWRVEG